jgi:hypothetical protein
MIGLAAQHPRGHPIGCAYGQGPAAHLHFLAVCYIDLLRLSFSQHAVRRVQGAIDVPMPCAPRNIGERNSFEDGMAPHPQSLI